MKIIYNNRKERLNWGARSTGKALQQLLMESHQIVAEFDASPVFFPSKFKCFKDKLLRKWNNILIRSSLKVIEIICSIFFPRVLKNRRIIHNSVEETANSILKFSHIDKYLKYIIRGIESSDAIVINGEGSMIFGNPTRLELFFFFALIKIAKEKGKKAYYINAIASDNSVTGTNDEDIYEILKYSNLCEYIIVRDLTSFAFLKERNISNVHYCPDTLFTWIKYLDNGLTVPIIGDSIIPFPDKISDYNRFDFNKPYILIAGSSYLRLLKSETFDDVIDRYVYLVNTIKKLGYKIYLVESCGFDSFLNIVAEKTDTVIIPSRINIIQAFSILAFAKVFITGRYHPAILASMGGTPCVFMNSNSHKTLSLQVLLEYKNPKVYSPLLTDTEIDEIFLETRGLIEEGNDLRDKIRHKAKELAREALEITAYVK